jgi:hypothetical protein
MCEDCNEACSECYGEMISECEACNDGWYFDSDECYECDPACSECTGSSNAEC